MHGGLSGVLPLRPLTAGELLDSAVWLLRGRAAVLLPAAAALACAEQLLLPAFEWAVEDPFTFTDWLRYCAGVGWGAFSIAVLGGVAARAAGAAVVGARLPDRALLRPGASRLAGVFALAVLIGAVCAAAAFCTPLVWLPVYALLGLVVPAFVVDRAGPLRAIGRGVALAARSGLRAAGIRLLGYLAWLAIRLAWGFGGLAALAYADLTDATWAPAVEFALWASVHTVAYAALACLDAVLHLETRMRTEGLDIWLARAGYRRPLTLDALARRR